MLGLHWCFHRRVSQPAAGTAATAAAAPAAAATAATAATTATPDSVQDSSTPSMKFKLSNKNLREFKMQMVHRSAWAPK